MVLVQLLQRTVRFVDPQDPDIGGRARFGFGAHIVGVDIHMMKDARATSVLPARRWILALPTTVGKRTLRMEDDLRRAELRLLKNLTTSNTPMCSQTWPGGTYRSLLVYLEDALRRERRGFVCSLLAVTVRRVFLAKFGFLLPVDRVEDARPVQFQSGALFLRGFDVRELLFDEHELILLAQPSPERSLERRCRRDNRAIAEDQSNFEDE